MCAENMYDIKTAAITGLEENKDRVIVTQKGDQIYMKANVITYYSPIGSWSIFDVHAQNYLHTLQSEFKYRY